MLWGRIGKRTGFLFAACLVAVSPGATKTKLGSADSIAGAIAAKLPHGTIYVAYPTWNGKDKGTHFLLLKEIGKELAQAFSVAGVDDKVVAPPEALRILAKTGFQTSDVYLALRRPAGATYVADLIGATVAITSEVRPKKGMLLVSVQAAATQKKKRYARFKALISISPQVRTLLAKPDVPIIDGGGVYAAGVGGIGTPTCLHCPNPPFPDQAIQAHKSGTVLVGLTVGTTGKVSDEVLLAKPKVPGIGQAALETIRSWQFRPALGPGGAAVPVRMVAECSFRFR